MEDKEQLQATIKHWCLEKFDGSDTNARPVEVMEGGEGLVTKTYTGHALEKLLDERRRIGQCH